MMEDDESFEFEFEDFDIRLADIVKALREIKK
jgi:hypothetical protein